MVNYCVAISMDGGGLPSLPFPSSSLTIWPTSMFLPAPIRERARAYTRAIKFYEFFLFFTTQLRTIDLIDEYRDVSNCYEFMIHRNEYCEEDKFDLIQRSLFKIGNGAA
ncbi:hypothetical protein PUN28_018871 [Cardiocondyla obscurior]|uniref:Uncharacterized protein n=1 Tax=Cardiocondyla obscurior TaxID=286306 RepID=A0AAW2EEE8_9HYME